MNSYINDKETFDLQQRHATEPDTFTSNKKFFSDHIVNIFMFTSIISIITIMLINKFSQSEFIEDKKCSTEQDSNLHPWHSRSSALPLDHLHYFLFSSS